MVRKRDKLGRNVIVDYYKKMVKKMDKQSDPKKLKKCAELFFKDTNEQLKDRPVTFEDITYLDGYFLFAYGTNTIVHFHVKECPGWLFGIWWDFPGKKSKQDNITGELFAQYEETIEKFKPSRSTILTTINAYPDDNEPYCTAWDAAKMIAFIRDEPYLAFCQDYWSWNYNREYHTREEAKTEFDKWHDWYEKKKRVTAELDAKVLDFVKKKIMPIFVGSKLEDYGEDTSPRYQLIAPYEKNKELATDGFGYYGWFNEDDQEDQIIMNEYNTLMEEGKKLSDQYDFYWSCPIDANVLLYIK